MDQMKMLEMQFAVQQIKEKEKELEQYEMQVQMVDEIIETLGEFDKTPAGSPMLFPLQNGIFAEATMGTSKTLRINVGADTVVEKTPQEAIKLMQQQQEEIIQKRDSSMKSFQELIEKISAMEQELKKR